MMRKCQVRFLGEEDTATCASLPDKYLWDDEIISKEKAETTLSMSALNEDIYLYESFSYNPPLLH